MQKASLRTKLLLIESQAFCEEERFPDGVLVTEDKMVMFLAERVLNRPLRTNWRKRDLRGLNGEEIQQRLSYNAVESYCSSIIDLWRYQSSSGINPHPQPRGAKLKALLKDRHQKEFVRKKTQYVDRGAGTLMDGYDSVAMQNVVRAGWTNWTTMKRIDSQSIESHLRTAVDFLFGHTMLLRSEHRRDVQLPDLFSLELKNMGPTPCKAMIMILNQGKTNPFGRLEYATVVRHKEVLYCPMSQLAFYFFYRWECTKEPPPRFQQRQMWYDLYVLKASLSKPALSYETQLEWTNRLFTKAGLRSYKKTHAGRVQGSQDAELAGVPEAQIRRAGRWNTDAMSNCYLSGIPLDFVRSTAGFRPTQHGDYYLPRAKVQPPASLVRSLWPWVDQWRAWFSQAFDDPAFTGSYEELELQPMQLSEEDRIDLAGQGFLRLLNDLRTILLQDSVILRREFPQHPVWQSPIFVRDDYTQFAQEVEQSLLEVEEPDEVRLRKIVPDIANRMNLCREDIVRTVEVQGLRTHALLQSVSTQLDDLFSGRFSVTFHRHPSAQDPGPGPGPGPHPIESTTASTTAVSQPVAAVPADPLAEASYDAAPDPSASAPACAPRLDPAAPPPPYMMNRTIGSVHDLWREWTVGLGSGPSIQALEAAYGASWRKPQSEKVWFGRRKVIIEEIRQRAAYHATVEGAVEELELVRRRQHTTLNGLSRWIKAKHHCTK